MNPYQQQVMNPYQQQQMINPLQQHTYNKQISYLNRAMELESKLSYYVNVRVDLYPGTSLSLTQEASALCSSRFERIRESLAKIFGFSYMSAPLVETYAYQRQNDTKNDKKGTDINKDKDKDKKRGGSQKNLKLKKNNSIKNKTLIK
jgi:hypothetical protein